MAWQNEAVGGHPCEVFRPATRNPNGYVVLYLHGVHEGSLADQATFTEIFQREGLVVVAPRTRRCWWLDRICREFDERLTPEQHLLQNVVPYIESEFQTKPPRIGLLGTSMGGKARCDWPTNTRIAFPLSRPFRPPSISICDWTNPKTTIRCSKCSTIPRRLGRKRPFFTFIR
jgi:hypothetical protein